MSNLKKQRNHGLDGLRGIAALAVVAAHSSLYLRTSDPISARGWGVFHDIWYVLSSGSIGVQYLFVLCGFLMGYLYWWEKNVTVWEFLKKRYARIFPLYTAVATYDFIRWKGWAGQDPFVGLLSLFAVFTLWHVVWVYIFKRQRSHMLATVTMALFVTAQLVSIVGNSVVSAFFYTNGTYAFAGTWLYDLTVYSANLLLTTPFLPSGLRLQGLFWSLAPEILYYHGYIFLFRPFVGRVYDKRSYFLAGAGAILAGFYLMYEPLQTLANLQSISILRWTSFIGGMYLGWMLRKPRYHALFTQLAKTPIIVGVTALGIPLSLFSGHIIWEHVSPLGLLLYIIAITVFVCLAIIQCILNERSVVARLLSVRVLAIVGTCSYSMYLIHGHVMRIANLFPRPANDWHNVVYVLALFPPVIAVSYLSYWLVERPYFMRSAAKKV